MRNKSAIAAPGRRRLFRPAIRASVCLALTAIALGQTGGTARITLEEALRMASQHNHSLLATRTTIQQNVAAEVTANLRPNPTLFTDWEYLPVISGSPSGVGLLQYLHDSTEGDIGLSYLFERGQKRQHRVQAAKDATAVARSQVADTERSLAFQVAQLFISVQLAESTIELARQDLKSFQSTLDLSDLQFKTGTISQNDYLQIKLQMVQYQTDLQQGELARAQGLSDLRQQLGYESVPANYDITGPFEYQPLQVTSADLEAKALQARPDLRAAHLSEVAANSQHTLAQANGKQDVTVSGNYSHVNGISSLTFSVSISLPIFDRNQGNIAQTRYAIAQAQEQRKSVNGQVLTDVSDAFQGLRSNERVVQIYLEGALDTAQKSRDIVEYAYRRGGVTLLDLLNAERSNRATQLAYRQTLAAYLTSLEQLRQAVGTRALN